MSGETVGSRRFLDLIRNGDYFLAGGLFAIVLLLVLPVPKVALDLLLAISIGASILILLVIIYVREPIELSVFPTILLIVTLYRLALNIASTRLILLDGDAGKVIESFGNFVVGGNYVVGAVVFLILVIVNFIVITKGSGRIAEVAARFTLDAMPGKQMAIDAELNAGIIDEKQATSRRQKVQREADFYGKMDGASKFVRGDAVAGILITLINVIGGFGIGIAQRGMSLTESLERYTLLSIGDGLVSQIPALILSIAAGLLITRASGGQNLGSSIGRQLGFYPRALGFLAGVMLLFGLLPGMPATPFFALGLLAGGIAWILKRSDLDATQFGELLDEAESRAALPARAAGSLAPPAEAPSAEAPASGSPEDLRSLVEVDLLSVELGYSLLGFADRAKGGELLDRIAGVRKNFARDVGVILPTIAVRDNFELEANEYRFLMRGRTIARGRVQPNRWMAMNVGGSKTKLDGETTREPVFGLEATWVNDENKKIAEMNGFTVVDAVSVLITHLSEILREHAHQIIGRQDVQQLVDNLKEKSPALVAELLPDLVNIGIIQRVLQHLLKEGLSIKNLSLILECIADFAPHSKNPDDLAEQARRRLAPYFMSEFEYEPGRFKAITLDPRLEQHLLSRVQRTQFDIGLTLDPRTAHHILEQLTRLSAEMTDDGLSPAIVTMGELRLAFKRFFESSLPRLSVISYQEIPSDTQIQNYGIISSPESLRTSEPAREAVA